MVSLQASSSPSRGKTINYFENPSKKRKWEESILDMETPLPLDWQRCLDIQSGQIHFYNTRTKTKTSQDPRKALEPLTAHGDDHMSLDLELNLPCYSPRKNQADHDSNKHNLKNTSSEFNYGMNSVANDRKNLGNLSLRRSPSWLASEKDDHQEMVATVCMKCHMLVLLCKSTPTCPNCKFMHPLDQNPPSMFKSKCSLLY